MTPKIFAQVTVSLQISFFKDVLRLFKMDVNISGVLDIINDNEVGNNKKQSVRYYSTYVLWCFRKTVILSLFLNIFFRTNTVTKTHAWQGLQLYILLLFTVNSNFRQC